jgi:hypothetical protein
MFCDFISRLLSCFVCLFLFITLFDPFGLAKIEPVSFGKYSFLLTAGVVSSKWSWRCKLLTRKYLTEVTSGQLVAI